MCLYCFGILYEVIKLPCADHIHMSVCLSATWYQWLQFVRFLCNSVWELFKKYCPASLSFTKIRSAVILGLQTQWISTHTSHNLWPTWLKISTRSPHKTAEYLWASLKLEQGKLHFSYGHNCNYKFRCACVCVYIHTHIGHCPFSICQKVILWCVSILLTALVLHCLPLSTVALWSFYRRPTV